MWCSCRACPPYPAHQAYDDRSEQQRDPGAEDQPDHLAHLGRAHRQLGGGTERSSVLGGHDEPDVVDPELGRGRLQEERAPATGGDLEDLGVADRERRVRPGLDAHAHGVVEVVGDGGGEPARGAGEGDGRRGVDADRGQLAVDATARPVRLGARGVGVLPARVRQAVEGLAEHVVGDVVAADQHLVEGLAGPDQVVGGSEVRGVQLAVDLALGIVELVTLELLGGSPGHRVDGGELEPRDVQAREEPGDARRVPARGEHHHQRTPAGAEQSQRGLGEDLLADRDRAERVVGPWSAPGRPRRGDPEPVPRDPGHRGCGQPEHLVGHQDPGSTVDQAERLRGQEAAR